MDSRKERVTAALAFGACLLPVLLFSVIYLGIDWMPANDTLGQVYGAMLYLNQMLENGEIPLWNPYVDYGVKAHVFFPLKLHPSLLALIPVLKLNSGIDALEAFFFSMLLSEIILVTGTFKLSRLLFQNRYTAIFTCLAMSGTIIWTRQVYFNFQIFYALPLVLYFLVKGIKKNSPKQLALGFSVLAVCSFMGQPQYFVIITGLFCLIFAVVFLLLQDHRIAIFRHPLRSYIWFLVPFGLTVLFLTHIFHGGEFNLTSPGRNASGLVDYGVYLNWVRPTVRQALEGLFFGLNSYFDFSVYCGFVVIPFAAYGLFRFQKAQLPFIVSNLFLLLMFVGSASFLAPVLYHFPPLNMYRHLGHLAPLLRIGMIFLAAFGFEKFLNTLENKKSRETRFDQFFLLGFFTCLALVFLQGLKSGRYPLDEGALLLIVLQSVLLLILLRLVAPGTRPSPKTIGLLILLVVALDVWSFRSRWVHDPDWGLIKIQPDIAELFAFQPMKYEAQRRITPFSSDRYAKLARIFYTDTGWGAKRYMQCVDSGGKDCPYNTYKKVGELYPEIVQVMGIDPCYNMERGDLTMARVERLAQGLNLDWRYIDSRRRETARSIVGCNVPKMQFFKRPAVVADGDAFLQGLSDPPGQPAGVFFIEQKNWEQAGMPPQTEPVSPYQELLKIPHKMKWFSPNRVLLEGEVPAALGPVWLNYVDTWDTGWHASLNGKPVPLLQGNLAFKALPLPAGKFEVEFNYRAPVQTILAWGMVVIAFVFMGSILVMTFRLLLGRE